MANDTEHVPRSIIAHYESCLAEHGDGARAVDWKSPADAAKRYDVMLGLMRTGAVGKTLLDFGCGTGALKTHMQQRGVNAVYVGLEVSSAFAEAARKQNPETRILCLDVLADDSLLPRFDYVVMNGVFTRRHDVPHERMDRYMRSLLRRVWRSVSIGLAFNVMAKAVDFESEQLFYPEPGELLGFVGRELTRHFVLRSDYGLHESTLYLYREPLS